MFFVDVELEIKKLHTIIIKLVDKEYKLKLKIKIHHHEVLPLFFFNLMFILTSKLEDEFFPMGGE